MTDQEIHKMSGPQSGLIKCARHNQWLSIDKRTQRPYCPKCRRNRDRKLQNAALRNICGTSARAAREDMGL